jgi:hypothetical protein
MKYMVMIYDKPGTRELFMGPDGKELMAEMESLMGELSASGELVSTNALADPAQTLTLRAGDGAPVVTDGPLAEAKEHFGGYVIVDCDTQDRAVEIASRWPSLRFSPLEIRPIMDVGGGHDL